MQQTESVERSTSGAARLAPRRADDSIREAILRAIAQAPWLAVEGVSVIVERGEVEFGGSVAEPRLRAALREIAGRCRGVRGVSDSLRVAENPGATV